MNRFDICAAYNLYSQLWGWDNYTRGIQARLARIRYKPSDSEQTLEGLSDDAREVYYGLVERYHPQCAEAVRSEFNDRTTFESIL